MTQLLRDVWVVVVGAVFGLACARGGGAPTQASGPPAGSPPIAHPAGPRPAPQVACAAEPTGLASLLHPGALIVFGEVHGTVESPAFVADAACHAARSGREVAIGLEIPRDLQPQLDRFLDSDGQPSDVAALLQGEHWNLEDGTASKALLGVIEEIRVLRHAGRKVRAFFFDIAATDGGDRDQNMAANIAAQVDRDPEGLTLVLTGNMHAKADSERWMSWHIARHHHDVLTLNVAYSGGSAYVCMMGGECGEHTGLKGKDRGNAPFIEVFGAPDGAGYNGVFYLGGPVTASPPVHHRGPIKVLVLP